MSDRRGPTRGNELQAICHGRPDTCTPARLPRKARARARVDVCWFFILVVDIILICIFTGNQIDGLMCRGCSEGRDTLPWFILVWTSPFLLTFCCSFYVIEHNPDAFYGNSRSTKAEFQTLLL
jgi:hypothetical protein